MSSALSSRNESSSRTWWSLSSRGSNPLTGKDLERSFSSDKSSPRQTPAKPSSGIKFNTLASAIGFKSKKHPALTIQEPPMPTRTVNPSQPATGGHTRLHTTNSANRPPSKSVSSTRSRADSIEPRTPLDGQRDTAAHRQSLLTLSDSDPFAGRGISAPRIHSDPNRLSAYSNSSVPNSISKKTDVPVFNRASYASSSSHSYDHGGGISPFSSSVNVENTLSSKLKPMKSTGSLRRKPSLATTDDELTSAWGNLTHMNGSTIVKSGSSSTLTDKNRFSQPDPTPYPRPPMRARGMTESGSQYPSPFPTDETFSRNSSPQPQRSSSHRSPQPPPVSPRVIIRQPSVSRIGLPTSAPPAQDLPPPPPHNVDYLGVDDVGHGSASSSSLSFASTTSSNREILGDQRYSLREKPKKRSDRSPFPPSRLEFDKLQNPIASTRTLKKALSQQNIGKRSAPAQSILPSSPPERAAEKSPRKQRSFHHPRIPLPPIPLPLRHTSSFGSQSTPSNDGHSSPVDSRGGSSSGPSTPGRKRLFSGSSHRRPSTSQCTPFEDDALSLFSLQSNQEQTLGSSFTRPFSSTNSSVQSSFWEEGATDHTQSSPPPTVHEYTPQQIMSPAEMAKVEASVEESSIYSRRRGLSVVSSAASEREEEFVPAGLSPPPSARYNARLNALPVRRSSMMTRGLVAPPRLSLRPSTSDANIVSSSTSEQATPRASSSPPSTITSLPPPPRPRPRPLAPQPDSPSIVTALSPPPVRRILRAKVSMEMEKVTRKSLMRKPSFLEIDDDIDRDPGFVGKPLDGSFLDLARESFDTVRSSDE